MSTPFAVISPKGEYRVRMGHPWVFQGDVFSLEGAESGDIVALYNKDKVFLAWAFYSRRSRITFRIISREPVFPDRSFWRKIVTLALDQRRELLSREQACRLIFSEADGLSGLIADWYAGHLVLQSLIPGIDKILNILIDIFCELLEPDAVLLRNDLEVRALEGLSQEIKTVYGKLSDSIRFQEGTIFFETDLLTGQKTGAYLDQRENRLALSERVPLGGRFLDCFCYQGGFALHLARKAGEVIAVDDSINALERAKKNMEINGVNNINLKKDNIFDFLKKAEASGERFDLIVLDPPPFAKKKADLPGAVRGYTELNRRALRCLLPGGWLNTFSCSYHITEPLFMDILFNAVNKAGVQAVLLGRCLQSQDHPIKINFPESLYLKGCLLKKL